MLRSSTSTAVSIHAAIPTSFLSKLYHTFTDGGWVEGEVMYPHSSKAMIPSNAAPIQERRRVEALWWGIVACSPRSSGASRL